LHRGLLVGALEDRSFFSAWLPTTWNIQASDPAGMLAAQREIRRQKMSVVIGAVTVESCRQT
jgi:hypothetical protein